MARSFTPIRRAEIMRELSGHNGWRCHYCHLPLVPHGREDDYCESRFVPYGKDGEVVKAYRLPDGYSFPYLDHKVPQHLGGSHNIDNLVLACMVCNSKKAHRHTYEDFYKQMAAVRAERAAKRE